MLFYVTNFSKVHWKYSSYRNLMTLLWNCADCAKLLHDILVFSKQKTQNAMPTNLVIAPKSKHLLHSAGTSIYLQLIRVVLTLKPLHPCINYVWHDLCTIILWHNVTISFFSIAARQHWLISQKEFCWLHRLFIDFRGRASEGLCIQISSNFNKFKALNFFLKNKKME